MHGCPYPRSVSRLLLNIIQLSVVNFLAHIVLQRSLFAYRRPWAILTLDYSTSFSLRLTIACWRVCWESIRTQAIEELAQRKGDTLRAPACRWRTAREGCTMQWSCTVERTDCRSCNALENPTQLVDLV